ncbi:NAD(P)-dependent alcohol dehydrogenase [Allokutzneria sp. NRRL B-24872]|uniref:NAD(P)-dependent alcohol dehydrogenase n=1 Tax=Allokutzneria sp. NRRL B-24872 TaxID=1137961 RepID=UPI000A3A98F0|nr:NAD(P)-dependent alcohol dehydrogenase [Allokutzneria sp. NRRL B-24872]
MKAIVQHRYGSTETLALKEIDWPVPGPGQVLVRVRAAGIGPDVTHLMTGKPYLVRLMGFGLRRPKVAVRGRDVAGVVEAVGPGVSRLAPGEEVFGTCEGSLAEYAVADEGVLTRKPANLSFDQAAAVPISGGTALQGLHGVHKGQRVLVIGAGGGVGTFAVQIAASRGAHVTGVCGPAKLDMVRDLGAERVIDYTTEDITAAGHHDLVLDAAGCRTLRHLRRALRPKGTLVIVGGENGGNWLGGVDRTLRAALWSPFVGHQLRGLISKERAEDFDVLRELIEDGAVTPVLDRTFPLERAAEAIDHVHGGHTTGKVVVSV